MAQEAGSSPLRVGSRRLADEWALVLVSQGLTPTLRGSRVGVELWVPASEREHAAAVLAAHEEDRVAAAKRPRETPAPVYGGPDSAPLAAVVSVAMLGFFLVTGPWRPDAPWFQRGAADAERILAGELWRTVTALTLHADGVHVLANAAVGFVFLAAVCRALGSGLGLVCVLLAGTLGNFLNAVFRVSPHVSVGASTAVFAAAGCLGGLGLLRLRRGGTRGRRAFVPLAASLGLLAMLGTAGERTDLWAHGFGFCSGLLLGVAFGAALRRAPSAALQALALLGAAGLLVGSWLMALR